MDLEKIAIHCPTQEVWDKLLNHIDNKHPTPLSKSDWEVYEEGSCINEEPNGYYYYCNVEYYLQEGYEIVSIDEYLNMKQGKSELKENLVTALATAEILEDAVNRGLEAAVGNINSDAKGSGARYNSGKPDYSLIVIEDMLPTLRDEFPSGQAIVFHVLDRLGHFQQTHERAYLYDILDSVGLEAIEESTHVFAYGAKKYKQWNWIKGMNWSVPLACAVRHSLAILSGEDVDAESGRKHIGHVVCNVFMLIHYAKFYKEGNDLPPVEYFK